MPVSKRYDRSSSHRKADLHDMEALHALMAVFKQHGLDIPFERLGPVLAEHQLLMEQRATVNELAHQLGPSHIQVNFSRHKPHARQP